MSETGTLYVVGIGPGLPEHLTATARRIIESADCVVVADLYRAFLREDGTLPPADAALEEADERVVLERDDGTRQTLLDSSMGEQRAVIRATLDRVRDGEDVAHVSGGDPNVYGKADLVLRVAREAGATDVPIEVVPGVTAALGGAAALGAPLSNDVATVSLSTKRRDWADIETRLRTAATAGFVLVLYNCWNNYERALAVVREERDAATPVAVVTDAGRGDAGRAPGGESRTLTTLGTAASGEISVEGMGTTILVGTPETDVWETEHGRYLVTPRGDDPTDF